MLDKKDFKVLLKSMNDFDNQREKLIKKSRDVLKLSKQLIYSLHRSDLKTASRYSKDIKKSFGELNKLAADNLKSQGSFKIAAQEYVEALCFYGYVIDKKIPTHNMLKVNPEHYLLGICDLTGEVVRKAINEAINGNTEAAITAKSFTEEVYGELLKFDFRQGNLRKNFDRIKYDLRRLEDLALDISLK